ncbi:MAG: hypothetical protein LBR82_00520, partial [Desulfovibrio sp.]|nr:hypothetical protein [Desulfovibrio sp.]
EFQHLANILGHKQRFAYLPKPPRRFVVLCQKLNFLQRFMEFGSAEGVRTDLTPRLCQKLNFLQRFMKFGSAGSV